MLRNLRWQHCYLWAVDGVSHDGVDADRLQRVGHTLVSLSLAVFAAIYVSVGNYARACAGQSFN